MFNSAGRMREDAESTYRFDPDSTMVTRGPRADATQLCHALIIRDRDGQRERRALAPGVHRVGRMPSADLVLTDPEASRLHCALTVEHGVATLADLGSTNGTWLGAERIGEPVALEPGCVIRIGGTMLHYQRGDAAEMRHAEEQDREIARAAAYALALLPPPIFEGPIRADWRFVPSGRVGGDAFGYRWLDADRFALFMMDVTGHGAGSALLAASVMNMLRQRAPKASVAEMMPEAVFAELNAAFQMDDQGGLFFSAWYGVFDRRSRLLRHASAGHHPAYVLTPGAPSTALCARNPPIGMMPGVAYAGDEAILPSRARMVMFSDGAFETLGPDGEQRGLADYLPAVTDVPIAGLSEPERLLRAARAAMRPGPFDDDVSILVVEFD